MLYTLQNDRFTASVNDLGAELWSLRDRRSGREYIWQGDARYWTGRSPVLFPIVGRLKDDAYLVNGRQYHLKKHGFARGACFAPGRDGEGGLTMTLESSEQTLAQYPFRFRLSLRYRLDEEGLEVEYLVANPSEKEELPFSLGAHPALCCRLGDTLRFERRESLDAWRLGGEQGLLLPERTPLLRDQDRLTITEELFAADALILEGPSSGYVELERRGGEGNVRVCFGRTPCLGLWAKPGAPYVCVEPWFGLDDGPQGGGELRCKKHVQRLQPGGRFRFLLRILPQPAGA